MPQELDGSWKTWHQRMKVKQLLPAPASIVYDAFLTSNQHPLSTQRSFKQFGKFWSFTFINSKMIHAVTNTLPLPAQRKMWRHFEPWRKFRLSRNSVTKPSCKESRRMTAVEKRVNVEVVTTEKKSWETFVGNLDKPRAIRALNAIAEID